MTEEVKKEEPIIKEEPKKKVDVKKFKKRLLHCANQMEDKAKAKEIADRVLRIK